MVTVLRSLETSMEAPTVVLPCLKVMLVRFTVRGSRASLKTRTTGAATDWLVEPLDGEMEERVGAVESVVEEEMVKKYWSSEALDRRVGRKAFPPWDFRV